MTHAQHDVNVTGIENLIDPVGGYVSGKIFHDADIYEQELQTVWQKTWVFLAHDSMLPKKGNYIQTYIGEDPVIVCRQKDGSVKAFLNQCRHRGMRICRADRGLAKGFMCSFHGWAYGLDGTLLDIPHEDTAYPQGMDKTKLSAIQVPRIENYNGFIFGSWDENIPPLEEYLGNAKYYLDGYLDRYAGGMEAIAVHKWVLPANWKFNVEQPTSDMQHSEISHVSAVEALASGSDTFDRKTGREKIPTGRQWFSPYGHGGAFFGKRGKETPNTAPALIDWENTVRDKIEERLGEFREVRGHMNVFPNFMLLGNYTFRVTHPRGPHEMEIWSWAFVPKDAPEEVKESIRLDVMRTFSPAGMFEQDDAENWEEMQHILKGAVSRKTGFTYNMRGVPVTRDDDGYPGGSTAHVYSDNAALNMYGFYRDMMMGYDWPQLKEIRHGEVEVEQADFTAVMPDGADYKATHNTMAKLGIDTENAKA
ncbi:aromatic ring-hydroxylating oxygenase subunit alpha [Corynebacterium argentoratense]|uniref:aromatic ring-hydroxylating oxygenase subunit alpha n=1 Tax=Corynebacterium argentoratense TaxID=42817 RepID=UPI004042F3DB